MKEKLISVNQVNIQICESAGEGMAAIFLHCGGANLMMWKPIVPFLQDHYRVILVDLRGHGKSSRPQNGYHMDEMAEDVIGVMDTLGIEKAHIVGSSLGAEVGLSMAANYPDRVISLICEGALYSEYGPYGTWKGSAQEFDGFVTTLLEKIRSRTDATFPTLDALIEENRKLYEEYGIWNHSFEEMIRYGTYKNEEGMFLKSWGKTASEDYTRNYFYSRFEEYYYRVKCPILMLPDEDLLKEEAQKTALLKLKDLAKHAEILEIMDWSHPYGWLLMPEKASEALLNFWSKTASLSSVV